MGQVKRKAPKGEEGKDNTQALPLRRKQVNSTSARRQGAQTQRAELGVGRFTMSWGAGGVAKGQALEQSKIHAREFSPLILNLSESY